MRTVIRVVPILALLAAPAPALLAQSAVDPAGHWEGTIQAPNVAIDVAIDLAKPEVAVLSEFEGRFCDEGLAFHDTKGTEPIGNGLTGEREGRGSCRSPQSNRVIWRAHESTERFEMSTVTSVEREYDPAVILHTAVGHE